MGMYDYLTLDYPIPQDGVEISTKQSFQTKSFLDCGLDYYHIAESGPIYTLWKYVHISDTSVDANTPKTEVLSSYISSAGYIWARHYFTGYIVFYDLISGVWVELRATMKCGILTELQRMPDRSFMAARVHKLEDGLPSED